jgi:hypothetical protein
VCAVGWTSCGWWRWGVHDHPAREEAVWLLALALYLSGCQVDALAVLRHAREHLAEELGVDPGPELRAPEAAVLDHDPLLDARPARAAISPPAAAPIVEPPRTSVGRTREPALLLSTAEAPGDTRSSGSAARQARARRP